MWSAERQDTAVISLILFILTALAALAVYRLSLAPDLTWAHFGVDGGELITAVATNGLPHPPGYPLYRLLARPLLALPLGSVAYRFNLFSAFTMALAAGFVALTGWQTRRLGAGIDLPRAQRGITAVALGLTFAFAPLVWSQALITEVYGLALLLLAAFLWALLTARPFWLTGLLLGLSVTAHLAAWLLLPLALALTPRQGWPRLLAGLLGGLLPLALLPWLAADSSPVVWGDPSSLAGWWWLVSGRLYAGYLLAWPPAAWGARLTAWVPDLAGQFTVAGLPLMAAGVFLLARGERRAAVGLGATAVLFLLFAFTYLPDDAIVQTLPAWLLLSLLLLPAYHKLRGLALFLPLVLLLINFNGQSLLNDQGIRPHAAALLSAVPSAAIVETPGDGTIFALWYFHFVEGQRPDLILVDRELFAFDWYRQRLARLYPELVGLEQADQAAFRAANGGKRPYCLATLAPPDSALYALDCSEEDAL